MNPYIVGWERHPSADGLYWFIDHGLVTLGWLWLLGDAFALAILLFIYSLCNIAGLLDRAEERRLSVPPKEER